MLNIFKTNAPVENDTLNRILQETIWDSLKKKGFKSEDNLLWFTNNKNSIRHVFKYVRLKGEQGTFSWGVCLDFVPTISGSKIRYHRTDKSVILHLFEWTDEYANSFYGGQLEKSVTTHWGKNEAKKSIRNLFENYEMKIFDWFEKANSIDNLIEIASRQIQASKSYSLHSPNPQFVLAFLYARIGQLEKAIFTFEQITAYKDNEEFKIKIKQELTKCSI